MPSLPQMYLWFLFFMNSKERLFIASVALFTASGCTRSANSTAGTVDAQASVAAAGRATGTAVEATQVNMRADNAQIAGELTQAVAQLSVTPSPTNTETSTPKPTATITPSSTEVPTLAPVHFDPSQNEGGDNSMVVISGGVSSAYDNLAMTDYINAYQAQSALYPDLVSGSYDLDMEMSPLFTSPVGLKLNWAEMDFWTNENVGGLGFSGDEIRFQGSDLIKDSKPWDIFNASDDGNLRAVLEIPEKDLEFALYGGILAAFANRYPTLDWEATGLGSAREYYDGQIHRMFNAVIDNNGFTPNTTQEWIGSKPLTSTVSFLDGEGQVAFGERTIDDDRSEQSPETLRCVIYEDGLAQTNPNYSDETRTKLDTGSVLKIDFIYDPTNPDIEAGFAAFIMSGAAVPDSLRPEETEKLASVLDTEIVVARAEQARWVDECKNNNAQGIDKPVVVPVGNTPVVQETPFAPNTPEASRTNVPNTPPAPTETPKPTNTTRPTVTATRTQPPTPTTPPTITPQPPEPSKTFVPEPAKGTPTAPPPLTETPTEVIPTATDLPQGSPTPLGFSPVLDDVVVTSRLVNNYR